jgi:hypothetical protein
MVFDPQIHHDRHSLIQVAIIRRRLTGLPEEKNISVLYNEICLLLGLPSIEILSTEADHFPSPGETDGVGKFIVPRKDCSKCGKKEGMLLTPLCVSCKEAEGGKYKSGYTCNQKLGGCGFVDDKTDEWFTQRLSRMGMEIPTGTKESLGILTSTDEGLK